MIALQRRSRRLIAASSVVAATGSTDATIWRAAEPSCSNSSAPIASTTSRRTSRTCSGANFKTSVDTVIADPRFNPSVPSVLAGRPAVLVTVQGGNYSAGTPREGWDHATGWMRRILADVWSLDLEVVESAFTLVGENPALDEFTDLAAMLRTEAEQLAEKYGQALDTLH